MRPDDSRKEIDVDQMEHWTVGAAEAIVKKYFLPDDSDPRWNEIPEDAAIPTDPEAAAKAVVRYRPRARAAIAANVMHLYCMVGRYDPNTNDMRFFIECLEALAGEPQAILP